MESFGSSKYQSVYAKGRREGFEDLKVRHYYDTKSKNAQIRCRTPFTYEGKPLIGIAVVPMVHVGRDTLRESHDMMLGLKDETPPIDNDLLVNIEDLYERKHGTRNCKVVDERTGAEVDYFTALNEMGEFAAAVSEFPHVETRYEYDTRKTVETAMNSIEGKNIRLPNYEDYQDDCLRRMQEGERFVGAIKTPESLCPNGQFIPGDESPKLTKTHTANKAFFEDILNKYIDNLKKEKLAEKRMQSVENAFGTNPSDGSIDGPDTPFSV